eukprot:gnl/TRDRNA2_/TRDRNA2_194211_c0_seq1.p1 gnl/TRDRNA2_/TRDRNA2_194211_c0~~gnl/TRDRNA2_/TRDRNA2_194211_c0_seq1.p1  ORF type:complete len:232 (+),score=47.30 gnl/TRDRNA2_/TRDRNA2_194211_c0_seq1:140-835(+)
MAYSGTVKFLGRQGYGYIAASTGEDYFFHIDACGEAPPQKDDVVAFNIEPSTLKPGNMQACNVTGGTGAAFVRGQYVGINVGANAAMAKAATGSPHGTMKNWNSGGFGFVTATDGTEHFIHVSDCPYSKPQEGDTVAFDIADNPMKPGTTKAINVVGGTAPLHDKEWETAGAKGKGKKGKGMEDDSWGWGWDPMSMMMGMMMAMKGKGSGKDKGYGKMSGGDGGKGKGALW